jgi:hypothetical protein
MIIGIHEVDHNGKGRNHVKRATWDTKFIARSQQRRSPPCVLTEKMRSRSHHERRLIKYGVT